MLNINTRRPRRDGVLKRLMMAVVWIAGIPILYIQYALCYLLVHFTLVPYIIDHVAKRTYTCITLWCANVS